MSTDEIKDLCRKIAEINDVDENLLLGIVKTESNFDQFAIRFESHYIPNKDASKFAKDNNISLATEETAQKFSWGLCQIMGGTARGLGYLGPLSNLTNCEINLNLACKLIKQLIKRYPTSIDDVIAAYNAGSAKKNSKGEYFNQGYVVKVKNNCLLLANQK
jgi:soluble lytic murein transglycosylase-like protein